MCAHDEFIVFWRFQVHQLPYAKSNPIWNSEQDDPEANTLSQNFRSNIQKGYKM